MKLIIGLGNPGIEYQFTPHNLGFLAIDRIANNLGVEVRNRQCRALTARAEIAGQPVILAKPETFMNLSGLSVRELLAEYQADSTSDLIVIYDELEAMRRGKYASQETRAAPDGGDRRALRAASGGVPVSLFGLR